MDRLFKDLSDTLAAGPAEASAPCRIDLGGTLDLRTFHYPLRHLAPGTFNIALALRTKIQLLPYEKGIIKVSSKGFESAEFKADRAPFDHPLGLMFAVACYFGASGVHIKIASASPPRSALGGSSSAAVALTALFTEIFAEKNEKSVSRKNAAILAHAIEETVAGVPCGMQDQLAAAYGGVNAWIWPGRIEESPFIKKTVVSKTGHKDLEKHILVAYCGIPHESKNINGKWVAGFLSGEFRKEWFEIISCTKKFIDSLSSGNYKGAAEIMNRETEIRTLMTPDVLDKIGKQLVKSAIENGCGARFTGAGGGGCIWAIGDIDNIISLKKRWQEILGRRKESRLLDNVIDVKGLEVKTARENVLND